MSLPFDKIIKPEFLVVCFDKRLQKMFSVSREHEIGKSILVPFYIFDFLSVEFNCRKLG
jgi:hypothetical protein